MEKPSWYIRIAYVVTCLAFVISIPASLMFLNENHIYNVKNIIITNFTVLLAYAFWKVFYPIFVNPNLQINDKAYAEKLHRVFYYLSIIWIVTLALQILLIFLGYINQIQWHSIFTPPINYPNI